MTQFQTQYYCLVAKLHAHCYEAFRMHRIYICITVLLPLCTNGFYMLHYVRRLINMLCQCSASYNLHVKICIKIDCLILYT